MYVVPCWALVSFTRGNVFLQQALNKAKKIQQLFYELKLKGLVLFQALIVSDHVVSVYISLHVHVENVHSI